MEKEVWIVQYLDEDGNEHGCIVSDDQTELTQVVAAQMEVGAVQIRMYRSSPDAVVDALWKVQDNEALEAASA